MSKPWRVSSFTSSAEVNKGKGVAMEEPEPEPEPEPPKETTPTMEDEDPYKIIYINPALHTRHRRIGGESMEELPLTTTGENPPNIMYINPAYNIRYVPHEYRGGESVSKKKRVGGVSKMTWSDANIQALESIDVSLWHVSPLEYKRMYMQAALDTLCHQVTQRGVVAVLVCACGLVSCKDSSKSVFPVESPLQGARTQAADFETRVLCNSSKGGRFELPPLEDEDTLKEALKEGSYLCAAVLRLVVKKEYKMVEVWYHLKKLYRSFYRRDMMVRFDLDIECLKAVREILQSLRLVKNTVGAFLLEFQTLKGQDREMCKMLLESPMCYTGMNAYSLLLHCEDKLQTPHRVFVTMLQRRSKREALEAATAILEKFEFPQTPEDEAAVEKAKTWRYARIFDEDVFAAVHTKNCIPLSALLAVIAEKIGAGDFIPFNSTSVAIAISNYRVEYETRLDTIAGKVIESCRAREWEN